MATPDVPPTTATAVTENTIAADETDEIVAKDKRFSPEEFDAYISDPRFNRIFELPADPSRGRPKPFQVSYADFGFHREDNASDDAEDEQVLLFFGPLVSSRLHNIAKDGLAKRYKVRIVSAERPGIGKTDSVPAEKLLEIWRGKSMNLRITVPE